MTKFDDDDDDDFPIFNSVDTSTIKTKVAQKMEQSSDEKCSNKIWDEEPDAGVNDPPPLEEVDADEIEAIMAKKDNSTSSNTQPQVAMNVSSTTSENTNAKFIQSDKFVGSKSGFVFKSGEKGIGYYSDSRFVPNDENVGQILEKARKEQSPTSDKKIKKNILIEEVSDDDDDDSDEDEDDIEFVGGQMHNESSSASANANRDSSLLDVGTKQAWPEKTSSNKPQSQKILIQEIEDDDDDDDKDDSIISSPNTESYSSKNSAGNSAVTIQIAKPADFAQRSNEFKHKLAEDLGVQESELEIEEGETHVTATMKAASDLITHSVTDKAASNVTDCDDLEELD